MHSEGVERKLTTILVADVVGYSRLMGADEEGTLMALRACREVIDGLVAEHRGRVFGSAGDSVLAEFASAVEAVGCAAKIQRAMGERNAGQPDERRMRFRIGVNLGDVMVEDGNLLGDGVNVAARLEGLAEPDGICISGSVYEQVKKTLDLGYDFLGKQEVKNIAEPVPVFGVRIAAPAAASPADTGTGTSLSLPEKASIAVLPFVNMSGDQEQEYFSDGITEDIITELSRYRSLFVISRNSSFAYKGKSVKIQDVARDLGVQYVVEGSVRKAGDRVRVTVQLIDAESDRHVWAERYDRDLQDIFAVQDEITSAIVAILPGRIEAATHERAKRKLPENLAAYEFVLAGKVLHHRSNKNDNDEALRLLDRAITLDPKYAHAHAWKACTLGQTWVHGWCEDREATWQEVIDELQIALALDENDSDVHRILAAIHIAHDEHDKAVYHQERALSLNPNDALIVVQKGEILTWLGQPEEGIEWIRKAIRLDPYHPERFWNHVGRAHYTARQYAEAADAFKRITAPDHTHHAFLAACYAGMGDEAAAESHAREVLKQEPEFTIASYMDTLHYKYENDRDHLREGLTEAGLPE